MLFRAFFAFPFQIRQCNRSTSVDDHRLRGRARRITRRQAIADLFEMLKSHRDMEPVENRRFQDASIGENAPESRTTIGEGRQRGVLVPPTASRFFLISPSMSVPAFATPPKT